MVEIAPPPAAANQAASMPALSAEGVRRAAVLCQVDDRSVHRLALQKQLCAQVARLAADQAPVPVAAIGFGDPALLARDTLGVLVHAAVTRQGAAVGLVLSVRPFRSDVSRSRLFGATPVAVTLGPDGAVPDAVIKAALDQVLPWRAPKAR